MVPFAVLEGGLDLVITSLGLFDVGDEFRLGVHRGLVGQLSTVAFWFSVPAMASFLQILVFCHW